MSTQTIDLANLIPCRTARLVAAEVGGDGEARLYQRQADGSLAVLTVPFQPWLLVAGRDLAESIPGRLEARPLSGNGRFDTRVFFPGLDAYDEAVKFLKATTGQTPTSPQAPYRVVSDLQQQLFAALPARLFRDLTFSDLHRLQLDIETITTPGYDFPNANRPGDAIVLVALRDSRGWEQCLASPELNEHDLLAAVVRVIRERDPDVIEGHNLFNFDLPYIEARSRLHKVRLDLGRDGSRIRSRPSRFTAGEHVTNYTRYEVSGRHIIDTLHLVQLYDVAERDLESYSLKAVARHFGVAAPDRTYLASESITQVYQTRPETLRAYALDDVRETEAISRLLSPSFFYQAQMIPFSYQNCVTRGNAARIDALLVAAYLGQDHSIPSPQAARPFQGGLTDSLATGVFRNVWHADVRSLYPSIIISRGLTPRQDALGVFTRMLAELRRFRLAAKDASRSAPTPAERDHYAALQGSFKVLINSFYGYMGFAQGTFNDFGLAETVTATGRDILRSMMQFLADQQATLIEVDTDGIYFVPPPALTSPRDLEARLQAVLPPGIEVELDAVYAAMLSYKSKNYALLDADGKVSVTGAALKSRGLEPFQRRYIHDLITLILTGRTAEVPSLHSGMADAIRSHRLPLSDLAKREVLSSSLKAYQEKLAQKTSRRSAAYELALRSGREYNQGDQVAYYVVGEGRNVSVTDSARLLADSDPAVRDENVAYYLDKLESLHARFLPLLPA